MADDPSRPNGATRSTAAFSTTWSRSGSSGRKSPTRHMIASDADITVAHQRAAEAVPQRGRIQAGDGRAALSPEKLRDDARMDLLVNRLLENEVNAKLSVKPADVSAFYEKNPDKFKQPKACAPATSSSSCRRAPTRQTKARGKSACRRGAEGGPERPGLRGARAAILAGRQRAARRRSRVSSSRARQRRHSRAPPSRSQPGQISDVVEIAVRLSRHQDDRTTARQGRAVPAGGRRRSAVSRAAAAAVARARHSSIGLKAKGKVEIFI